MAALEVNAQRKLQNEDCRAGDPAPLDSDAPKHSPSQPPRQPSQKGRKPEPQRRHGIKMGRECQIQESRGILKGQEVLPTPSEP